MVDCVCQMLLRASDEHIEMTIGFSQVKVIHILSNVIGGDGSFEREFTFTFTVN